MKNLILLLLLPIFATAQFSITGTVRSSGNEPIIGASVFLNNTTLGSITDDKGHFRINSVPAGKHEVIVSIIGYERSVSVIELSGAQQLNISLKEKSQQLNEIVVTPFEKDGWQKWGTLFLESFIGTTENAERTRLKNWKDLRFRHNKEEGKLEVVAMKPLIIENRSLGYNLEYHLEVFEINFNNRTNLYAGYPFFRETKNVSKKQQKNREESYESSLTKFMRALYHNTAEKEGYLIRKMVVVENKERKRVQELYRKYTVRQIGPDGKGVVLGRPAFPPEIYTADSLKYFDKVLSQPKETSNLYKDPLPVSELVTIKVNKSRALYFENYLHIVNTSKREDKKFIEYQRQNRNPGPQTSILLLLNDEDVEIQENGNYFPPLNILSGEYWGWSNKIADLLPLDYTPRSSTP